MNEILTVLTNHWSENEKLMVSTFVSLSGVWDFYAAIYVGWPAFHDTLALISEIQHTKQQLFSSNFAVRASWGWKSNSGKWYRLCMVKPSLQKWSGYSVWSPVWCSQYLWFICILKVWRLSKCSVWSATWPRSHLFKDHRSGGMEESGEMLSCRLKEAEILFLNSSLCTFYLHEGSSKSSVPFTYLHTVFYSHTHIHIFSLSYSYIFHTFCAHAKSFTVYISIRKYSI